MCYTVRKILLFCVCVCAVAAYFSLAEAFYPFLSSFTILSVHFELSDCFGLVPKEIQTSV